MARPRTPPFTLGSITYEPHPTRPGQIKGRGYYTDGHRQRREARAVGKSEAAVRRELQRRVAAARDTHRGGDSELSNNTKLVRAADLWLEWKQRERKKVRDSTLKEYRGYVDRCIKRGSLSKLTVLEANDVNRIEAWLCTVADERGETAAKQSRKVLSGILKLAERRNAIPASVIGRVQTPGATPGSTGDRKCTDPDCDYDCGKRHLDTKRAFTPTEALGVQKTADASVADVGDLTAFLFGTGARISEALHNVDWSDVDLEAKTVHVRGTKTAQADRILAISDDLTARLTQRGEIYGTEGLVFGVTRFATKLGRPRDTSNVLSVIRRVLNSSNAKWAGSHSFRRTVASWMDEAGASLAEIANQLGHANTNITAGYLGRRVAPTRAASIMVLPKGP
ncbi:MAG: hypothetical protein NVSMB48_00560 [Marmoricola sp.]